MANPNPNPNPIPNIVDTIAGPEETEESIAAEEKAHAAEEAAAAGTGEGTGEGEPGEDTSQAEAAAAAKAKEEAQPERSEMVPHAALQEERLRRQELQNQLSQTTDKITRMETLFEQFKQDNPRPEDVIPDPEEDLAGHLQGNIAAMQKKLDVLTSADGERQEQEQAQGRERQLLEQYAGSVRTFSQATPDFNDAYGFLAKSVDADLIARGYDDPAERSSIMQYEEGQLVGRAMRAGKDPAELIYSYAKSRGYAGKPPGEGEGGESEEDKLERLTQGAEAGKTLSGTNTRGEGATTLERLAELADEDPAAFDREWTKAQRQGLLG